MNPNEVNVDFKVFVDGRDFEEAVKEKFQKEYLNRPGDKVVINAMRQELQEFADRAEIKVTVQLGDFIAQEQAGRSLWKTVNEYAEEMAEETAKQEKSVTISEKRYRELQRLADIGRTTEEFGGFVMEEEDAHLADIGKATLQALDGVNFMYVAGNETLIYTADALFDWYKRRDKE